MSGSDNFIFKGLLLTKGAYCVELTSTSVLNAGQFKLVGEAGEIAFEPQSEETRVMHKLELKFNVESPLLRVSMEAETDLPNDFLFHGIKRREESIHFRSDFFDFHFSLKDHVRQIDNVLRFTEGEDELSILFKTLRNEMAVNVAQLRSETLALAEKVERNETSTK